MSNATNNNRKQAVLDCIYVYSNGTNRCAWVGCDEDRIEGLCMDHKEGGGNTCGFGGGKDAGGHLSPYLKRLGFPNRDKYQVLCANHNMEKVIVNNERHAKVPTTEEEFRRREELDRRNDQLRWDVLSAYSGSPIPYCKVCGRTYLWHLCLDHVDDDGAEDRRKYGCSGTAFYAKLKKLGYPDKDKYQVLCYTCNLIKERAVITKATI